jgi:hypothetical protein
MPAKERIVLSLLVVLVGFASVCAYIAYERLTGRL